MTILSFSAIVTGARGQREFGADTRPDTRSTLDGEPAVQRLNAVADVGQPAVTGAVWLEP